MPRGLRAPTAVAMVIVAAAVGLVMRAGVDRGDLAAATRAFGPGPPRPVSTATRFSLQAATAESADAHATVVARARRPSVAIFHAPGAERPIRRIRARRVEGHTAPLVFAVRSRRGAWLRVATGRRPNASTGWVHAANVRLATTDYHVRVELRAHRLIVMRSGRAVMRAGIAVGRALSPTPTGRYFITELLRAPDPHGFYGPYALGLSAYSPVYTTFAGGHGQVGIHGTNDPAAIGHDVSHGCIRVRNAVVTRLARRLPLGTPVSIAH